MQIFAIKQIDSRLHKKSNRETGDREKFNNCWSVFSTWKNQWILFIRCWLKYLFAWLERKSKNNVFQSKKKSLNRLALKISKSKSVKRENWFFRSLSTVTDFNMKARRIEINHENVKINYFSLMALVLFYDATCSRKSSFIAPRKNESKTEIFLFNFSLPFLGKSKIKNWHGTYENDLLKQNRFFELTRSFLSLFIENVCAFKELSRIFCASCFSTLLWRVFPQRRKDKRENCESTKMRVCVGDRREKECSRGSSWCWVDCLRLSFLRKLSKLLSWITQSFLIQLKSFEALKDQFKAFKIGLQVETWIQFHDSTINLRLIPSNPSYSSAIYWSLRSSKRNGKCFHDAKRRVKNGNLNLIEFSIVASDLQMPIFAEVRGLVRISHLYDQHILTHIVPIFLFSRDGVFAHIKEEIFTSKCQSVIHSLMMYVA